MSFYIQIFQVSLVLQVFILLTVSQRSVKPTFKNKLSIGSHYSDHSLQIKPSPDLNGSMKK